MVYAAKGQQLTLKFKHDFVGCTLTYSIGETEIPGNDKDGYTLTVLGEDTTIGFMMTTTPLTAMDGTGTQANPYQVPSDAVLINKMENFN